MNRNRRYSEISTSRRDTISDLVVAIVALVLFISFLIIWGRHGGL